MAIRKTSINAGAYDACRGRADDCGVAARGGASACGVHPEDRSARVRAGGVSHARDDARAPSVRAHARARGPP